MILSPLCKTPNSRRCRLLLAVACILLATPTIHAQTAAPQTAASKPLAWDAVTIKPSKPAGLGELSHSSSSFVPNGFSVSTPLRKFISDAYGIREDLIQGLPKWAESTQYDIEAKVAGTDTAEYRTMTRSQMGLMVQSILTDRFKLTAHTEIKQLPVYGLVVSKPDRLPVAQPGEESSAGMDPSQIKCQNCGVSVLVDMLSRSLQRTVVDSTGLTGKYDIKLQWSDSAGPSLFTAIEEQLGLKLDSTKGPVKTLIVEHVEPPSAN